MKQQHLRMNNPKNRDVVRLAPDRLGLAPPRQLHGGLLVLTLVLVCFGLVMLFSASITIGYSSEGNALYFIVKQVSITVIGLIAALVVALMIPVGFFDRFWMSVALYGLTTGLLLYVKQFGTVINAARRWILLPGFSFQPSELAKITLVFCFAGYTAQIRRLRRAGRLRWRSPIKQFVLDGWLDILLPGLLFLIWIGLVAWQPHLSGALILSFVTLVLFLTAGLPLRSWLSALTQLLLVVVLVLVIGSLLLSVLPSGQLREQLQTGLVSNFKHVVDRMDRFMHPEHATDDDLYQVNQAIIAMGSGGLSGVGLGEGRQKYNYLPEAHNDYVFAIIGEELGFAGTVTVVLLFFLFMVMGIGITRKASGVFATLLAGGYTMLISVQAFLNFGVATHLLPPTGISLPFFSYGGTSNLFFLFAIGLLLSVSKTGQLVAKGRPQAQARRPATGKQPQRLGREGAR